MPCDVPSSLAGLLSLFGSCFTAPTFETFCGLAVGLLTRVRERTVTGMLSAAGLAGSGITAGRTGSSPVLGGALTG